jgi:hypothetical protein
MPPVRSKNGGKAKKVKDPNAPKRPMSAYFLFMNATRAQVYNCATAGAAGPQSEGDEAHVGQAGPSRPVQQQLGTGTSGQNSKSSSPSVITGTSGATKAVPLTSRPSSSSNGFINNGNRSSTSSTNSSITASSNSNGNGPQSSTSHPALSNFNARRLISGRKRSQETKKEPQGQKAKWVGPKPRRMMEKLKSMGTQMSDVFDSSNDEEDTELDTEEEEEMEERRLWENRGKRAFMDRYDGAAKKSEIENKIAKAVTNYAKKEIHSRTERYEKLAMEKEKAEGEVTKVQRVIQEEEMIIEKSKEVVEASLGELKKTDKRHAKTVADIRDLEANLKKLRDSVESIREEREVKLELVQMQKIDTQRKKKTVAEKKKELWEKREKVLRLQKEMDNLTVGGNPDQSNKPLLALLDRQIATKKTDLECPVCFWTCATPIFRCPAYHLVCNTCRPRMQSCGECREKYTGLNRHRYAERDYDQLTQLEKERASLAEVLGELPAKPKDGRV